MCRFSLEAQKSSSICLLQRCNTTKSFWRVSQSCKQSARIKKTKISFLKISSLTNLERVIHKCPQISDGKTVTRCSLRDQWSHLSDRESFLRVPVNQSPVRKDLDEKRIIVSEESSSCATPIVTPLKFGGQTPRISGHYCLIVSRFLKQRTYTISESENIANKRTGSK